MIQSPSFLLEPTTSEDSFFYIDLTRDLHQLKIKHILENSLSAKLKEQGYMSKIKSYPLTRDHLSIYYAYACHSSMD